MNTSTPDRSTRRPAVDASTLRPFDVLRVGASGPRARTTRTALSALGVSIGIAAMVGVLGLSESSKSALLDEISALGTNLLTVEPGTGFGGGDGQLPESAVGSIERLDGVETASAVYPFQKIDKNFDTSESELFVQVNYDLSEEQGRIVDRTFYIVNEGETTSVLAKTMPRADALAYVRENMSGIMKVTARSMPSFTPE